MDCDITIRKAEIDDAGRVLEFLRKFRAEGLDTVLIHETVPTIAEEKDYIRRLDGNAGIMILSEDRGIVVGCLTAEINKHPQLQHSCEFGIGVLSGHRGQGIGSQIMEQLLIWARSRRLRRIELDVFANNTKAIALYRYLGFVEEGRKIEAVRLGVKYVDTINMALKLLTPDE